MIILDFYGVNPSTALKNIVARKKERLNQNADSKIKSALIVQGGSMRGVFSAGSLIALEKLSFSQGFDVVYGSSGGAVNASYFLSNQGPLGASIYYEDINNSKFINAMRFDRIVDIDYLFDEVIIHKKPLDIYKVASSKMLLYFFATDISAGKAVRFSHKSKNFLQLLKASCALPFYYNRPVFIDSKGYLDGGICKTIPIEEAINDGCTDILVLLTNSIKSRKPISSFERFLVKKSLSKFSSKLFDTYLEGFENYSYSFDICIGKRKIEKGVNIATIIPDDNFSLNRLTKNEKLLKEAAIDGARKVFNLFKKDYDMGNILRYN